MGESIMANKDNNYDNKLAMKNLRCNTEENLFFEGFDIMPEGWEYPEITALDTERALRSISKVKHHTEATTQAQAKVLKEQELARARPDYEERSTMNKRKSAVSTKGDQERLFRFLDATMHNKDKEFLEMNNI